jgi:hypothetical protein
MKCDHHIECGKEAQFFYMPTTRFALAYEAAYKRWPRNKAYCWYHACHEYMFDFHTERAWLEVTYDSFCKGAIESVMEQ